jgi:hypothetical protein
VTSAGSSDQSVRGARVDADEYSTLAAGSKGEVTTDEKGQPTEHLHLSDSGLVDEELTDAFGEIVVVGHHAILGMTHLSAVALDAGFRIPPDASLRAPWPPSRLRDLGVLCAVS